MHDPDDAADAEVELDGFPVAADAENLQARETIEVLVSRFSDELRRGEFPSIEDYAKRYKSCADEIRELFPLIQNLERWKSEKEVDCLRRSVPQEFPIQRLGGYRIIRELGRGGMGVVFEAVRKTSGESVAVKLLPWRFAADRPHWKERFRREAATIARLRHPHIVQVYSFGMHDGYCYYVMELVQGVSLDQILCRLREVTGAVSVDDLHRADQASAGLGPTGASATPRKSGELATSTAASFSLDRDSYQAFAKIGMQVALALQHAHKHGVLHNDIKPANLLLRTNGDVVVTDFGIGTRDPDDPVGEENHAPGTLRYMAPERILGRSDVRSDVYSLGVTLYELVTRTIAFDAEDRRQLVESILESRPKRPRSLVPRIPTGLETIILNAISADPDERYPSADALATDLLRFQNRQKIRSLRLSPLRRAIRWLRGGPAGTAWMPVEAKK